MKDNYPVFCEFDEWQDYKGNNLVIGEYLVDNFVVPQLGGVYCQRIVFSYVLVKYLLNKFIDKSIILTFRHHTLISQMY